MVKIEGKWKVLDELFVTISLQERSFCHGFFACIDISHVCTTVAGGESLFLYGTEICKLYNLREKKSNIYGGALLWK